MPAVGDEGLGLAEGRPLGRDAVRGRGDGPRIALLRISAAPRCSASARRRRGTRMSIADLEEGADGDGAGRRGGRQRPVGCGNDRANRSDGSARSSPGTGRRGRRTRRPTPDHLEDGLSGVAAVSRTFAWAVGRHGTPTGFRTLVERWNGSRWAITPSANLGNSDALNDVAVAAPDAAWAVGWSVQGQTYATLALRWDGSKWAVVPTPRLGAGDAVLYGVAIAPSGAWAVGWISRGDRVRSLVERWTGRAWKVVAPRPRSPRRRSPISPFTEATIAIAGRRLVDGHSQPLAVVRKAGRWLEVPVDHRMVGGSLSAVAVGPSGRIWAVGRRSTATDRPRRSWCLAASRSPSGPPGTRVCAGAAAVAGDP